MDIIKYILMGILLLVNIVIIVAVLMQKSKSQGLSGLVSGGGETFFGKNKNNDVDAKLSKIVLICGIVFVVLCIGLAILINKDISAAKNTTASIMQYLA